MFSTYEVDDGVRNRHKKNAKRRVV